MPSQVLLSGAEVRSKRLVQLYSTLLAASLEAGNDVGRQYFSDRFARLRARLTADFELEQQAGRMLSLIHISEPTRPY